MLHIDLIPPHWAIQQYDLTIQLPTLRLLCADWTAERKLSKQLWRAARDVDLRCALVMEIPTEKHVPLSFIELADTVRCWNQGEWSVVKQREATTPDDPLTHTVEEIAAISRELSKAAAQAQGLSREQVQGMVKCAPLLSPPADKEIGRLAQSHLLLQEYLDRAEKELLDIRAYLQAQHNIQEPTALRAVKACEEEWIDHCDELEQACYEKQLHETSVPAEDEK